MNNDRQRPTDVDTSNYRDATRLARLVRPGTSPRHRLSPKPKVPHRPLSLAEKKSPTIGNVPRSTGAHSTAFSLLLLFAVPFNLASFFHHPTLL